MVEEPDGGEGHGNVVLVTGHDDMVITNATTCLGNELHTALMGTFNVVAKGEEGIGAQGYLTVLCYPLALLLHGEHSRLLLE